MKVIAFDAIISSDRVTSFHYDMFKGRQPVARMQLPGLFFGQPLTRRLTWSMMATVCPKYSW